jgi:putative heme-binding domain-containing protein
MRFSTAVRFWIVLVAALVAALRAAAGPDAPASDAEQVRRQRFEQHALTHAGDADHGRRLFLDEQRTKCGVCHRVNGDGGRVGPDLTSIGGKFDRPHLIESLLEPSRQIVEGYRTTAVVLADGRVLNGIVREQSETEFTLVDAENKPHVIRRADVESSSVSDVSIMPLDLEKALSVEEFTDLIAWLETLRPGGAPKFGAGITGPILLPEGFDVRVIATGISGATAMETLPDGRILICEQPGTVRVVEEGRLLDEALITLPVESYWERGVIGVTIDPDFPRQPWVYVCRVVHEPYPHHVVSRFTVDGNVADPESEQLLLEGDDQRQMGGKVPAGHQGGALHFGPDGKLYIGIGEQTAETPSQELDMLPGKILRINPDGSIPADNPFVDQTEGKYRAIWARGLRNPFTFAFNPRDGMLLINDVGGKFEEINVGRAGANYGWPIVEHGPTPEESGFVGPIYWYPQSSIGGGDFVRAGSGWPRSYSGRYVFADFVQGWIKTLDPREPGSIETFGSGLRRPVDLRFAPDGSLYVLLRNAWVIDDKFEGGTGSLLRIQFLNGGEAADGR